MRKLILAIAISGLSVVAQAETLPVVFGNVSDDELGMAHEIESGMAANRRCAGVSVTTNIHTPQIIGRWCCRITSLELEKNTIGLSKR